MISNIYQVKVYYKDVDQMGVVYYAHYFEYFEAARTELLRKIGLEVRQIEQSGFFLPVLESHCNYLTGAKFDDILEIEASIHEVPEFKLRIDYSVKLAGSYKKIADGYTVHVFTRQSNGKPCRIPSEFKNNFLTD